MGALMQISRGLLSQAETRPPKGDALNFVDWVGISREAIDFCDEHGTGSSPETTSSTLPGWAAEVLGYTVVRAHRPFAKKHPPDLETLLTILRLLRRYRAYPIPDKVFFVWVAKQLAAHHQTASDSVTLAEIVGELVPQLPQAERAKFARKLFAKVHDAPAFNSTSNDVGVPRVQEEPVSVQQLLRDVGDMPSTGVAVAPASASSLNLRAPQSEAMVKPPKPSSLVGMPSKSGHAQNRLWDRLSLPSQPSRIVLAMEVPSASENAASEFIQEKLSSENAEDARQWYAQPTTLASRQASKADEKPAERIAGPDTIEEVPSQVAQPPVDELRVLLEAALKRVEALEEKLEEQSSGLRVEVENLRSRTAAAEVKVDAMPKHTQPIHTQPISEAASIISESAAMPQLPSWPPSFFLSDSDVQRPSMPQKTTLHLRRPFNFEEFRRAETQGLQNSRVRVLVPPDPMQPFPRK
jgi:hypothetical protein